MIVSHWLPYHAWMGIYYITMFPVILDERSGELWLHPDWEMILDGALTREMS